MFPPRPARRTRGVLVEGATPFFLPLVRHQGGGLVHPNGHTISPPLWGVAPSTVIPTGSPKY